jgi:hypothetical protein
MDYSPLFEAGDEGIIEAIHWEEDWPYEVCWDRRLRYSGTHARCMVMEVELDFVYSMPTEEEVSALESVIKELEAI